MKALAAQPPNFDEIAQPNSRSNRDGSASDPEPCKLAEQSQKNFTISKRTVP
jgi:hypothetical protein